MQDAPANEPIAPAPAAPGPAPAGARRPGDRWSRALARLRPWLATHWPGVLCAAAGAAVAIAYLVIIYRYGHAMGFPLDDSYIYLTYAKQWGRGQPFTYYDGGGFSAGATSVLWPMLIAPLWSLGLRGYLFTFAVFTVCAALLAATAAMAYTVGRRTLGTVGGVVGAALIVCSGPFTWAALAGMETSLAAALLFASALRLTREADRPTPSPLLLVLLGATALARPEATVLVGTIVGGCILHRSWRRQWRAAALFAAPLIAPLAWMIANRIAIGHFFPNTGVAKSYFYLPGFDWAYYVEVVRDRGLSMLRGLFWKPQSPLGMPRLILLLWIAGSARLLVWAYRERRWAGPMMLVLASPALLGAVIASSGQWDFQNYRYIAAALPALLLIAGLALAPPQRWRGQPLPLLARRIWTGGALAIGGLITASLLAPLYADMLLFAQGARESNGQTVAIGRWIDANLPRDAHIAFHDAGAIAYYADRRFTDIIGLITNDQAEVCNNGPGSRFEMLESLPVERRPTHFAYYPDWMGNKDFFGKSLWKAPPLPPRLDPKRSLSGGGGMEIFQARWDRIGTGETPLVAMQGWRVVDRVDVADLASERAHGYRAAMGGRHFLDPTARWSLFFRATVTDASGASRDVSDGGRTIRGPEGERFAVAIDPAKPLRLVLRTGGNNKNPWSKLPDHPVQVTVRRGEGGAVLGSLTLPPPTTVGSFEDLVLELPADASRPARLRLQVSGKEDHRVFHYFVLQPE